jgi:CheY-like chemotaxis protein
VSILFGKLVALSKKVLVVEDHGDLLAFLGEALALLGWDAVLADSGREALNKLEDDSPSIIMLDMRMPKMDGFEFAGILKRHPVYKKIPILGASGYAGRLAREQCLASGCDDFISKPFAIAALQTRLTNLVCTAQQKATAATAV